MTETTYAYAQGDPHRLRGIAQGAAVHEGPAPKRIVTAYGFWIFLLSDIIMFACSSRATRCCWGRRPADPAARSCST